MSGIKVGDSVVVPGCMLHEGDVTRTGVVEQVGIGAYELPIWYRVRLNKPCCCDDWYVFCATHVEQAREARS